jgi:hypothetical protein
LLPSKRKLVVLLAIVCAIGAVVAGNAFTASNTVPNGAVGQGANTISGYAITGISYNPNGSNPGNIDSVTFTIAPTTASAVSVQLVSGGSWYSCTNTSGSVSCATTSPQATASAANSLDVVASQ